MQKFSGKQKCLNLGPKMPYLGVFRLEFKKYYCYIWNQHPWICLISKYREIMEMPKFGTKSVLLGCFWAGILKNYSNIWNQHLQITVITKFCEETEMPKFGTKNALFGCFWAIIFLKKLLSYLKLAPLNLSNWKILWNNENA